MVIVTVTVTDTVTVTYKYNVTEDKQISNDDDWLLDDR